MVSRIHISVALDVVCMLTSLIMFSFLMMKETRTTTLGRRFMLVVLCTFMISLTDVVAWLYDGRAGDMDGAILRVANFLHYLFGVLVLVMYAHYLIAYIGAKTTIRHYNLIAIYALCLLIIATNIIFQLTGFYYHYDQLNIYHRGEFFWVSQVFPGLCIMLLFTFVITYRKCLTSREFFFMVIYTMLPLIALAMQVLAFGITFINVGITLSTLVTYLGLQSDQASRRELELAEGEIAIMLSQIQPHFLYNTLTSIAALCSIDPKKAEQTITTFAQYLRRNMDSIDDKALVPFNKELVHIKAYLSLEKVRFGDKLNIVYDLHDVNFYLPSLTVQPIIENAVKHGVGKHPRGGTVTISTRETETEHQVIVSDDGIGFDVNAWRSSDRSHLGLDNVRQRLIHQCGGSLDIKSKIGKGTVITIKVPK